jgi:cytidine deaminase
MQESSTAELIHAAIELARHRFPYEDTCAAALKTETGRVLTSVWVEASVDSACLCAETGSSYEFS